MTNDEIKERLLNLECSKSESFEILKILEQLKYVRDIIPVDVMMVEILSDKSSGERYFYNNGRKIIMPRDDADPLCHTNFNRDYKVLEDVNFVVERFYELDEIFISTIIDTLSLFIVVFEDGIITEDLMQKYKQYMVIAENMVRARFDKDVVESLNFISQLDNDSSDYENILYLHQLAAYNIFSEKLNQLKDK